MLDSYLQRVNDYGESDHEAMMMAIKALEENDRLKADRAGLVKDIERWNEVSYEQHEAIKKARDEMQSLDEELCSRFLIEDCDKEAHEAYRECLDILDKYIHNMYVNVIKLKPKWQNYRPHEKSWGLFFYFLFFFVGATLLRYSSKAISTIAVLGMWLVSE